MCMKAHTIICMYVCTCLIYVLPTHSNIIAMNGFAL